jgi:hypothetical protein
MLVGLSIVWHRGTNVRIPRDSFSQRRQNTESQKCDNRVSANPTQTGKKIVVDLKGKKKALKLEDDKAVGVIEYFIPKDREANRWEIGGKLTLKKGPDWAWDLPFRATLILGPEGFFDIDDWEGDQMFHPEMRSLVWHHRPEVMKALPDEEVELWFKLATRVANKWLNGDFGT